MRGEPSMKAVLDHIGIAVGDLEAALVFFRDALGLHVETSEEILSQRVKAHFLKAGSASLELLEATSADSPIAKFLERRGAGLHHVALRVDDIEVALEHLRRRGIRLIDQHGRPGAEGAMVAFIHPSAAHGVLVELKQAKRRKKREERNMKKQGRRKTPPAAPTSLRESYGGPPKPRRRRKLAMRAKAAEG